ncbi:MAG: hypothetical protein KBT12_06995 [Bacteroidales bacterium]|nr:hypothetical protein [Candidatus Physcousia equi]
MTPHPACGGGGSNDNSHWDGKTKDDLDEAMRKRLRKSLVGFGFELAGAAVDCIKADSCSMRHKGCTITPQYMHFACQELGVFSVRCSLSYLVSSYCQSLCLLDFS